MVSPNVVSGTRYSRGPFDAKIPNWALAEISEPVLSANTWM